MTEQELETIAAEIEAEFQRNRDAAIAAARQARAERNFAHWNRNANRKQNR